MKFIYWSIVETWNYFVAFLSLSFCLWLLSKQNALESNGRRQCFVIASKEYQFGSFAAFEYNRTWTMDKWNDSTNEITIFSWTSDGRTLQFAERISLFVRSSGWRPISCVYLLSCHWSSLLVISSHACEDTISQSTTHSSHNFCLNAWRWVLQTVRRILIIILICPPLSIYNLPLFQHVCDCLKCRKKPFVASCERLFIKLRVVPSPFPSSLPSQCNACEEFRVCTLWTLPLWCVFHMFFSHGQMSIGYVVTWRAHGECCCVASSWRRIGRPWP